MSPLFGCSLLWVIVTYLYIASHDVFLNRPSVMMFGFISISEDILCSCFNPWFKIHSRPISHFFIHCTLQVCYLYFHVFHILNGATGPSLGCVVFRIVYFLNIPGKALIYHAISTSLLIYFSLIGVYFHRHAYNGSYQVHPTSTLKSPCNDVTLPLMPYPAFDSGLFPFSGRGDNVHIA